MGLVKTRRLMAMQKQQRENGIDERKFMITKIVYREGGDDAADEEGYVAAVAIDADEMPG